MFLSNRHFGNGDSLIRLHNGTVASGSSDDIALWIFKNPVGRGGIGGGCEKVLKGHSKPVLSLAELKDGTLVSSSEDKTIKLWNVKTGQCITTLKELGSSIQSPLLVLKDGTLVSGSKKTIKMFLTAKSSTGRS